MGLKRSVTTLRGGTLGYAEIVALKVNRLPSPRKARHASRCRDPDGRPPISSIASPRCFLPVISSLSNNCRSRRRFFSSSFHSLSPLCSLFLTVNPLLYHLYVSFFFCVRASLHTSRMRDRPRISSSSCSLASRCLVRCFRCSVLSLVYTKRSASSMLDRRIGASLFSVDHRFRFNIISEGIY